MSKVRPNNEIAGARRPNHMIIYYFIAFSLQIINFIPGFIHTHKFSHQFDIPLSLSYLFAISCVLSIPPLFESIVDFAVTIIYKVHHPNIVEHNFGHNLLLISLLLPVVLVVGLFDQNYGYNDLFASSFIDCCLGITVSAIYGKLQVFGDEYWNMRRVIPILILFVVSQTLISQGIATCDDGTFECRMPDTVIVSSVVLSISCLLLHIFYSRTYIIEVYCLLFVSKDSTFFTANNTTSVILIFILNGYFIVRIAVQSIFTHNSTNALLARTGMHILLACLASILPARMIRGMLVTMKHEMETKKTFIRYISHEIRSPLSTASLGLDYLMAQMADNKLTYAQVYEVVCDTKTSTEIATSTLNDLLMFDKIETGMLEVSTADCDMWEFVNHCVKPFNLQAIADQISMKCSLIFSENDPGDLETQTHEVYAKIDKYKMEQVVRNFLTNALKFTPRNGTIAVNVSTRETFSSKNTKHDEPTSPRRSLGHIQRSGAVVRVEVVDSGPGISAENLPKLFGQYVQFDANTLQGGKGSGLGLWLSKAIVEMHGGVIGATSAGVGQGCTFFLELPLSMMDDRSQQEEDPNSCKGSTGAATESSTVKTGAEGATERSNGRLSLQSPTMTNRNGSPRGGSQKGGGDSPFTRMASTAMQSLISGKASQYEQLARTSVPHGVSRKVRCKKEPITPKTEALKNIRVLLADDSALSRKMVERTLRDIEGCVCHHAQNGLEAVQMVTQSMVSGADQESYDVILMDYYMPVMSGPEAVQLIREQGYKGVVLAVTGVTSDSEFTSLLGKGVDRILVKPFTLEAFKQAMHDFRQ